MELRSSKRNIATDVECKYLSENCEEFAVYIMNDLANPERKHNFYANTMSKMIHLYPERLTSIAFLHRALYFADVFSVESGLFSWFLTIYLHNDEAYGEIFLLDDFPEDHLATIKSFRKIEIYWDLINGFFEGKKTPYLFNCMSMITSIRFLNNELEFAEPDSLLDSIREETSKIFDLHPNVQIRGKFNNVFGYNLHRLLELPNSAVSLFDDVRVKNLIIQISSKGFNVEELLLHLPFEDMNVNLINELEKIIE